MELFDANKAREKTLKSIERLTLWPRLIEEINDACISGEFHLTFATGENRLKDSELQKLKNYGYEVTFFKDDVSPFDEYYIIKWKDKNIKILKNK
ncbi:MAG: hypothetical protein ABIP51_00030 [Bacteroidia bacterium]